MSRDAGNAGVKKYKPNGMNRMEIVYESSSQDFALYMEDLTIHFKSKIENKIVGGSGPLAQDNPPYVVYIAWRMLDYLQQSPSMLDNCSVVECNNYYR